ncbi:hypothetical protein N431DRAFT_485680 [Stipitochalara longipes BDJ]|nr:hypothetical protein N431DRAFT_485680 [Stipitochalara longipes BDJ]
MEVQMANYSYEAYDRLPFVIAAQHNLHTSLEGKQLSDVLGNLFLDFQVENTFGVILLHRHFDLEPKEKLVHFGNSSVPWNIDSQSLDSKGIVPIAWQFLQDGLAPFEWRYVAPFERKPPSIDLTTHGPFLSKLTTVLNENQLDGIVGIYAVNDPDIDKPPMFEITTLRANINLEVNIYPDVASFETNWQFGKDEGKTTPWLGTYGLQSAVYPEWLQPCGTCKKLGLGVQFIYIQHSLLMVGGTRQAGNHSEIEGPKMGQTV